MPRRRGDPTLAPELKALIQSVGKDKLGPDITAQEKFHSLSLRIRRKVLEFLILHDGTTWRTLRALNAQAANYAECSEITAGRWVFQFTQVGAPMELVEAMDYWLLTRRGNHRGEHETAQVQVDKL